FEKYKGFEAKLETDTPAENGQRKFRGVIKEMENNTILIMTDEGEVEIPLNTLAKAKLVMTDDLIKATANL
ncbi:MAG: ribosome maturation factor RimP, partial [Micavibrio sp.]|nr:ribosome maturation factor RimP [Micavibrio sp.]